MVTVTTASLSSFTAFFNTFVPGGTFFFSQPSYRFDTTVTGDAVFTRPHTTASTGYYNINPSVTLEGVEVTSSYGHLAGTITAMTFASDNRGEIGRIEGLSIPGYDFREVLLARTAGDNTAGTQFAQLIAEAIGALVLSEEAESLSSLSGPLKYLSTLDMGGGDDALTIDTRDGISDVRGGEGWDVLSVNGASLTVNTVDLHLGEVRVDGVVDMTFGGFEVVRGWAHVTHFIGSLGADIIEAAGRDDLIQIGAGADIIDAGFGDDRIESIQTSDVFERGIGALNIDTGMVVNVAGMTRSNMVLDAGAGLDTWVLSDGDDAVFLHDALSEFHTALNLIEDSYGRASQVRLIQVDRIEAGAGDDLIDLTSPDYAGHLDVDITLVGGAGNDTLWGGDYGQILVGGDGDDVLYGGAGFDEMTGGAGADVFEFTAQTEHTVIHDFDPNEGDRLVFYARGGTVFDQSTLAYDGTHLSVDHNTGALSIEVAGTHSLASLSDALAFI